MNSNQVFLTVNASGAATAARAGNVVVIVDVIDMSTTMEAAIDAGAAYILGASPDDCRAPVDLRPAEIGKQAAKLAKENDTSVIIVSEPRVGTEEERRARSAQVIAAIEQEGARVEAVFPNAGAETAKLGDFTGRVVVAVSDTGGVAFDAAVNAGAPAVLTGTVARTMKKRGFEPARAAAIRAMQAAELHDSGIAVVAATANSLEDMLAAEYIVKEILAQGFTNRK